MRKKLWFMILFTCFVGLTGLESRACTTFQLNHNGRVFVGTNYDWGVEDGLVFVNKRGFKKTAMPSYRDNSDASTPAVWTSKYGSITFNQYGREFSFGGMNEAGLVIGTMGLFEGSKYPDPDSRPSIYMLQWLQYQLDNFSTVKEVIESDSNVRIRQKKGVRIHYLVSDKNGNCAAIEFIDGKMVCHTGETLPCKVLTNSTYDDSMKYFKKDGTPLFDRYRSIERFNRAAKMVKAYKPDESKAPLDYTFDILEKVSWSVEGDRWTSHTQWSIVYDVENLQIYFRTHGNEKIRNIQFREMDFTCSTPVKVLDVNADLSGNVSNQFKVYTREANRELIRRAFNKTVYLDRLPGKVFDDMAGYPDTFACAE